MSIEKPQNDSFEDLEALIVLAEKSTASIDELLERRRKLKSKLFVSLFLLYCIVSLMWVVYEFLSRDMALSLKFTSYITGAVFMGSFFLLFQAWMSESVLIRKELSVEFSIQQRLLSLIHEQLNWLRMSSGASPVVFATWEMRARRLERYK